MEFRELQTNPGVQSCVENDVNRTASDPRVSDAELVRRAQRREPAAFTELVARYQDRVYNTCYRLCRRHADALDLTQSTFLKALEALPQFEARSNFYTWLFRIAINLALSQRRAQGRRPLQSLDQPDRDGQWREPAMAADTEDVARRMELQELREQLEDALTRLDEEFRVVVVLRDVEDLDYAAIADILGVPVGTVKSRLHRGRLMLQEMLTCKKTERGEPGL